MSETPVTYEVEWEVEVIKTYRVTFSASQLAGYGIDVSTFASSEDLLEHVSLPDMEDSEHEVVAAVTGRRVFRVVKSVRSARAPHELHSPHVPLTAAQAAELRRGLGEAGEL